MGQDLRTLRDQAAKVMPRESRFSAALIDNGNVHLVFRTTDEAGFASVLMSQNDVHALISLLARCTLTDPDQEASP